MVKEKIAGLEVNHTQELAKYEPRYNELVLRAKTFQIKDEETKTRGIDLIRELGSLGDQYKKLREYILKPFKVHIKKLEGDFKPHEKMIEEIVGDFRTGLRGQLSNYETQMAEVRRKEEERLRAEQQKKYEKEVAKAEKKDEIPPPPPPPVIVENKKEDGVSYSVKFEYDVTDEKLVPREYLILNDKLIKGCINKGLKEIPGLRIYSIRAAIIRESDLGDL